MAIDNEKLKKFYINRNIFLSKTFNNCHFELKYDYTLDNTIENIDKLLKIKEKSDRKIIDFEVDKPFHEFFFEILDELDNEKIIDLMSAYYFKTIILKDKERTIKDSYSTIYYEKDNNFNYSINSPDQEKDTSMLYASYAHELIHFPQLLRNRNYEYMEYSEALSIFFEYLMYEKMSNGNGEIILSNNRVVQLYDNIVDFKTDLFYAKNNYLLGLPRDSFSICLADYLSYYESLEYVLQLIEYYKKNKEKTSDLIYRVLFDESSMKNEAEKLGIETKNYPKLVKTL